MKLSSLNNSPSLDLEIEKFANNWKVPRMATIDRNILRMSIYEMTQMKDIPNSVTIDEAVELSKQFGTAETAPFVNAILDSIRKTLA
jgi:N utilization substance protein B